MAAETEFAATFQILFNHIWQNFLANSEFENKENKNTFSEDYKECSVPQNKLINKNRAQQ